MAKRGRPGSGARFDLDEPLKSDFADFLKAHHGASQGEILHKALSAFMAADLKKNEGVRETYNELRRLRREGGARKLRVVEPPDNAG